MAEGRVTTVFMGTGPISRTFVSQITHTTLIAPLYTEIYRYTVAAAADCIEAVLYLYTIYSYTLVLLTIYVCVQLAFESECC